MFSHRPTPLQISCHDNEATQPISQAHITSSRVSPTSEGESSQLTTTTIASQVTALTSHVTTTSETTESSLLPWQPSSLESSNAPCLSMASDWEQEEREGSNTTVLTPVERLQMRFIKHTQQVGGAKPHSLSVAEDSNSVIVNDELISQLSARPG